MHVCTFSSSTPTSARKNTSAPEIIWRNFLRVWAPVTQCCVEAEKTVSDVFFSTLGYGCPTLEFWTSAKFFPVLTPWFFLVVRPTFFLCSAKSRARHKKMCWESSAKLFPVALCRCPSLDTWNFVGLGPYVCVNMTRGRCRCAAVNGWGWPIIGGLSVVRKPACGWRPAQGGAKRRTSGRDAKSRT